jgi:hypothetical protein
LFKEDGRAVAKVYTELGLPAVIPTVFYLCFSAIDVRVRCHHTVEVVDVLMPAPLELFSTTGSIAAPQTGH